MNITDQFTRNKFVDKCMSYIPDDPLTQSLYLYILTAIVFFGLLGYAGVTWWSVFVSFSLKTFFGGLFMTAIALISLFGLKQTRNTYLMTKAMYVGMKHQETKKIEDPDEMLKAFNGQQTTKEEAGGTESQEGRP